MEKGVQDGGFCGKGAPGSCRVKKSLSAATEAREANSKGKCRDEGNTDLRGASPEEGKERPCDQAHRHLTFASSPRSGTSCALTGPYAIWLSPCTWWGCLSEPLCSGTWQTGQS